MDDTKCSNCNVYFVSKDALNGHRRRCEALLGVKEQNVKTSIYKVPVELVPGTIIAERYELKQLLGEGRFGKVFEAKDRNSDEPKAIKFSVNKKIRDEIFILKDLGGVDGIPRLLHVVEYDRTTSGIVMELGSKDLYDLRDANGSGKFCAETVIALGYHIFGLLAHCHNEGWIHRDVKDSNILMSLNPVPNKIPILLVDWGLSIHISTPRQPQKNDSIFEKCTYATPAMCKGKVASRKDDCLMTVYTMIRMSGLESFDSDDDCKKRIEFENNPSSLLNDEWFINLAKAVIKTGEESKPDYELFRSILSQAKNFNPDGYRFEIKNENGVVFMN